MHRHSFAVPRDREACRIDRGTFPEVFGAFPQHLGACLNVLYANRRSGNSPATPRNVLRCPIDAHVIPGGESAVRSRRQALQMA